MASKRVLSTPRFIRRPTITSSRFHLTARNITNSTNRARLSNRVLISRPAPLIQYKQSIRRHSAPPSKSKVYDFNAMKGFVAEPNPSRIIVDVREPNEYSDGYIPGSINLPIKSSPEALLLPADEFEDRFGYPKPKADQEVVFYCKSGVRSSAAAKLAEQAGYQNIGEYRGSWLDWFKNGGEVAR